jgi:hypothetical protein
MLLPELLEFGNWTQCTYHVDETIRVDKRSAQQLCGKHSHLAIEVVGRADLSQYPAENRNEEKRLGNAPENCHSLFHDFPNAQRRSKQDVAAFNHNQVPDSEHVAHRQAVAEEREEPLHGEDIDDWRLERRLVGGVL